MALHPRKA
jgi:hypothetical protein